MWLGKSDLTDEHFVRTDDGVEYARSVRRFAEHNWSEENLKSVTETPQKPRSTTTDSAADPRAVPEAHEHEKQDEEANDNDGEDEEPPDKPDDEDHDMEGDASGARHNCDVRARAEERSSQKHKRMRS